MGKVKTNILSSPLPDKSIFISQIQLIISNTLVQQYLLSALKNRSDQPRCMNEVYCM